MLSQYSHQGRMWIWQDRSCLRLFVWGLMWVPVRHDVFRHLDYCPFYLKQDGVCQWNASGLDCKCP